MTTFLAYVGAVALAVVALVALYVAALVVAAMWGRFAPSHWWLSGPMRRAVPAVEVFRNVESLGGHAATFRRWVRVGPWAVYAVRYRAGAGPEPHREKIP
jgi:hypothetical protein